MICILDPDIAHYLGDEEAGIYFDAAKNPISGYWYMTAWADTEHSTDTLIQDDGPFKNKYHALVAGFELACEWCFTNDVRLNHRDVIALQREIDR